MLPSSESPDDRLSGDMSIDDIGGKRLSPEELLLAAATAATLSNNTSLMVNDDTMGSMVATTSSSNSRGNGTLSALSSAEGGNNGILVQHSESNDSQSKSRTADPGSFMCDFHPDLPFLVTHWLSTIGPHPITQVSSSSSSSFSLAGKSGVTSTREIDEALLAIRRGASTLASAFQTLGAFGITGRMTTMTHDIATDQHATFSDLSRKYAPLIVRGGAVLDTLVKRSGTTNRGTRRDMPWSLLEAAYDGSISTLKDKKSNNDLNDVVPTSSGKKTTWAFSGTGRRVGSLDVYDHDIIIDNSMPSDESPGTAMFLVRTDTNSTLYDTACFNAAKLSRGLHSTRIEADNQRDSLDRTMQALHQSTNSLAARGPIYPLEQQLGIGDDYDLEVNNLSRVVVQLDRTIQSMKEKYSRAKIRVAEAEMEAKKSYLDVKSVRSNYRGPSLHQTFSALSDQRHIGFGAKAHSPGKNNIIMSSIFTRQYQNRHRASYSHQTRLSVLKSRLSHAATISSHLIYPIYCLKFDRTGKYFITGSDDQVAKVFRLGVGVRGESTSLNYGVNLRGAILVCSLKGHAGVVADIDVNSDNSFLATASGDGDVRVWGLKDGWPVAILRGHTGGANMVSWSTLNPFRLVSCGEDGMARMWDVHEAALKRYSENYPSSDQTQETDDREHNTQLSQQNLFQAIIQQDHLDDIDEDPNIINNNIPGVEFGRSFGDFVVNSHVDEGVELTAQLQHGPTLDEINGLTGPVTRTGNVGPIKVMCIASCPVGGHFATGSSDGLGRVWADDDDYVLSSESDLHDNMTLLSSNLTQFNMTLKSRRSATRLLATLRDVHTHAVTDMKYSSAGDRIMTASMKDGNVCIWSGFYAAPLPATFCISSQLVIQLSEASRDGTHSVKVNCDGVAWTCDDMKVITSQSTPIKASGTEIIPESHLIYVWDSHSGKCLMGIISSHNALCPSLAPHPHLSSVFASTGADGAVNVWDLDRGDCFFSHANILLHGPIEPATDRGKHSGCLEAQFSPDGLSLILTDERGRVIILDTQVPAWLRKKVNNLDEIELREQYFANDYYELAYDDNGHCIERGSGKPPHLAPGGVRCNHEGVPFNEVVRETYKELKGPLPISPMLHRDENRINQNPVEAGVKVRRITVRVPDFNQRSDTPIIDRAGNFVQPDRNHMSTKRVSVAVNNQRTNSASRPLSNRYQWREDLPESEDDEEDKDDEDFEEAGRRLIDSSEDERDVFSSQSRRRQESGRGRGGSERSRRGESQDDEPARASSRHSSQRTYNEYDYSDDDALEELMSTHTRPSGTYVDDWNVAGHFFKLPRGGGSNIRRNWLSRTIHQGQKRYCPQVGDTVVYIPRAHDDTIQKFWIQGYVPPWKSWPTATSWPVVRCKVTHARYRFPYEICYKARSRNEKLEGVSVILTLEITGVPSKSSNRTFPWPVPTFVPPPAIRTRSCDSIEFEVTLFECGEEDFLVPEYLYSWRLKQLETAIRANCGHVEGLSVTALCAPEHDEIEDTDLVEYTGRLVRISETRDDEEFHLFDSGYNAVHLTWDGENIPYVFSVWNISVSNPSRTAPVSPTIGDRVTFDVRKALSAIKKLDPKVDEWFCELVDTSKYTDYLEMIEVPMYVSLIAMRLRSNYYTNKLSVVADVELMKENSYKYNEDCNDIHDLACLMYDEFKSLVDAIEEDHTISAEEHTTDGENDDPEQTAGSSSHAEDSDEGQVASRRRTRRSASQKSQLTVTGSGGHPAFARARKKSSYKDDDSEEDTHSGTKDCSEEDMSDVEEVSHKKRKLRARVTKLSNYEEKDFDEDDQEDESRRSTAVKKSRRPPPRTRGKPVNAEEDSMENIENEQRVSRRPTRRSLAQESQLASVGSPGQRTSVRARKKATYKDKDSDEEESVSPESVEELPSDQEVNSDEDEYPVDPRRPTRRAATQKTLLSESGIFGRLRSPRAARRKPSYQDISSTGGDESDESDDEKRPPPRGRRKPAYTVDDSEEEVAHDESDVDEDSSEEDVNQRKRRNKPIRVAKPAKKRSRMTQVMNAFPNLEKWQPVSRRLLNRVGLAVLAKLASLVSIMSVSMDCVQFSHHLFFLSHSQQRELDTLELFSRPVCEAYPIIAEEYLSVVKTPMDFQTIEEERLPKYENITELQDDIMLTFRNCCVYNGEVSLQKKYYKYSL